MFAASRLTDIVGMLRAAQQQKFPTSSAGNAETPQPPSPRRIAIEASRRKPAAAPPPPAAPATLTITDELARDAAEIARGINRSAARGRGEKLIADTPPPFQPVTCSAQDIVRAAAKARCEIEGPAPKLDAVAQAIVNAGKKRRGEAPMDFAMPSQPQGYKATAAEIIEAGKQRRGEK